MVPGPITSPTSLGANRLIYQGATPIIDEETFEDALFGLFGCLRREDLREEACKGGVRVGPLAGNRADDEPLLAALCANPMRVEQMLALSWDEALWKPSGDVLTWIMLKLASYERDGLVVRFPDGRYGPARL